MTTKPVTVFEGPDGSGKSTAARWFAEQTHARYVHLGPFPRVRDGLPRLYVESMLPALLGLSPVVLDRSWLSEPIYGRVFRGGANRIRAVEQRMIERVAWACGAVVVNCEVSLETSLRNFRSRRGAEMLSDEDQLTAVHLNYQNLRTSLSSVSFDYERLNYSTLRDDIETVRPFLHPLQSAGNLEAKILLVGEKFADHKNQDPLYQAPFVSFSGDGCSRWFTQLLEDAEIGEDQLCWINSDQLTAEVRFEHRVVALGDVASSKLTELNIRNMSFTHPQAWKRFHPREPYPLIDYLKETLACTRTA